MAELEKRISGDWIDIKEKSNQLYSLLEVLALPTYEVRGAADKLRLAVEQGVVEFKRSQLSPVLVALEAARYKSLDADEMAAQEKPLTAALLVVLVQRLLCADLHPLARPREEKRSFGVDSMDVSAILSDVNARLKGNPVLRAHPSIKNILMQVQRYNAENRKMRELLPTIKPELRTPFLANFTRTFEEIIASIRRHYNAILAEEAAAEKARQEGFSLSLVPLKELVPLLSSQGQELSRFRSTLGYAREEKYKTREILVRLYDGRETMLRLIEEELKIYRKICRRMLQYDLDGCALSIASGFRDEIVGILEKHAKAGGSPSSA